MGEATMKISKYGHACLLVEDANARILIDPGAFSKGYEELKDIDAVLITHQHQDHVTPEILAAVRTLNPDVHVYADKDTTKMLLDGGDANVTAVSDGDSFDVDGVKVDVHGTMHAMIAAAMPGITNVGYMVAGRFFYPGDNFTIPGVPVEILGLPVGAPWLKVSEVIEYAEAVKPQIAIPVHDAVLAMPSMHNGMVEHFTSDGIKLQVIEDGDSAEF
jgi:L-ascorbate metabolism protein UlaG (beta-lactamase superfamily)